MFLKFWKIPEITRVVEFLFTEPGATGSLPGIYPPSFNNVRFVEEFYKGESDREVIIIAAGGLGEGAASLPQQADFPIMGGLPSYQIFLLPRKS